MLRPTILFGLALVSVLTCTVESAALADEVPGRPLEWPEGPSRTVRVTAGTRLHVDLRALDPDGKPVSYEVSGLPHAATLSTHEGADASAKIDWFPRVGDVGAYDVQVIVRSGSRHAEQTLRIVVEEDWVGYLIPGAEFSSFIPNDLSRWGAAFGVSIQFVVVAWVHRNEQPGPSHGRIHVDLDILKSTRPAVSTALHLSGGFDLTFEKNPPRRFLLPFYGLDLGVMINKQQLTTLVQLTPVLGMHLYAAPQVFITLSGGYLMPLHGLEFDELRGVRGKFGFGASFW